MYKILFICYGNICRSPMALMIFKDMMFKRNRRFMFSCSSCGTSMEEIGSGMYQAAKDVLKKNNILVEAHIARQFKKEDYNNYDYLIVMEESNKKDLLNIVDDPKNKIIRLLDFTDDKKDIEDPWYTNNFEKVYNEIYKGCEALFNYLERNYNNEEL